MCVGEITDDVIPPADTSLGIAALSLQQSGRLAEAERDVATSSSRTPATPRRSICSVSTPWPPPGTSGPPTCWLGSFA